jgi:putative SOS response-associated peptidase YedK
MCSNFQSITHKEQAWLEANFQCELPTSEWHDDVYPSYLSPFVWLDGGQPRCELAQFGLVPFWAANRPRFGQRTYNARSETISDKPSYRSAWKHRQFGLAIMQSFYEPNYATGKAVRWRIRRTDCAPIAAASIFERYTDHATGEIVASFSLLTVNADTHGLMRQFHGPDDEKRSIVALQEPEYWPWLQADHTCARELLKLAPDNFLASEPSPKPPKARHG